MLNYFYVLPDVQALLLHVSQFKKASSIAYHTVAKEINFIFKIIN